MAGAKVRIINKLANQNFLIVLSRTQRNNAQSRSSEACSGTTPRHNDSHLSSPSWQE